MGSANCKEGKVESAPSGTYNPIQSEKSGAMSEEYSEPVLLCKEQDMEENEMRTFEFNANLKVLLIKQHGRLTAISNKCTHYGAPLHTGALGDGRVRCPWHGACFNIETGDIEDFPGLDSVPCFKVDVQENTGQVLVRVKQKYAKDTKRMKDMVKYSDKNEYTFVIVGGGVAGATCAETLRQEGFSGRIVMICRENNLPYDRVKVTKNMDIEFEQIQLRSAEFYEQWGIETLLGVEATKLDSVAKTISCSNGFNIKYERIFICTGCTPYKPPITGVEAVNVFTIRDYSDAKAIVEVVKPEFEVVCLGSSFIALEAAASLLSKAHRVTIVGRSDVPLQESLGYEVGQRVLELFQEKGVDMRMKSGIQKIVANAEGRVASVTLKDGTSIPCDVLILGTGSRFNTDFLKGSRVLMNENGSIDTDMYLLTNVPDVYVGGDIANAPVYAYDNQRATIGHYQLAQYHGYVAGCNMAGTVKELKAVPFFFTMLFGKGIRFAGYGKFVECFIEGDLQEMKFVAYYLDSNGNVISAASCGRDPIVSHFAELKSQGKQLHISEIKNKENPEEWIKKLNKCVM